MVSDHETERLLDEVRDAVAPLMILKADIEKHTAHRPTAIMLPLSLAGWHTVLGLPVIAGDRAALIYEPPKAGD